LTTLGYGTAESLFNGWNLALPASLREVACGCQSQSVDKFREFISAKIQAMHPLEVSPAQFRTLANEITEIAAQYLEALDSRPVAPATTGKQSRDMFSGPLPMEGEGAKVLTSLSQIIGHSRVQNARFWGYVLGSAEPAGAAADLLASVLNQNVTAWRSSPAAVMIEKTVVGWLAEAISCPGFQGSLTGGGSSANLMGLALAREATLAVNACGLRDSAQPVVYASSEVHMSIPKALALLGIGRNNLRLIPTDDQFRMLPAQLQSTIQQDIAAGRLPFAIVATAGTVNTGAVDPLTEIAELAKRFDIWMHVDGAYGALAAIAQPGKFAGIERADSISLDPHKWLYQALDCGCLLYRDQETARKTFSHTGDYARALTDDPIESYAFFDESLELSRRFRALRLWFSLRYHGLAAFGAAIEKDLRLAQRLAANIEKCPDLEVAAPVNLSAVCFRYRSAPQSQLDAVNESLLKAVNRRGRIYLSNATLRGQFFLRACLVNHRTTDADVDCAADEVLQAARAISQS
jgi:aromatic-L-amino-acid/L-tryptophan decarboxylase